MDYMREDILLLLYILDLKWVKSDADMDRLFLNYSFEEIAEMIGLKQCTMRRVCMQSSITCYGLESETDKNSWGMTK